jgi:hypothetical protein
MRRPAGLRWTGLVLAGACVLAAGPAAAGPGAGGPSAGGPAGGAAAPLDDVTRADALFAEGVKLRESAPEVACTKFRESLQLNPQAIGVLLNVAMCDERQGRIASAVQRYRETRQRAVEQRFPEYQKASEDKIDKLGPLVPHLTIRFDKAPPPETKIVIDDRVIPLSALDRVPLDPGERLVVISSPGRIAFERRVSIALREHRELTVPALQRPSSRRTIGKITLASGGAAVVTGIVLGYIAQSRYDRYRYDDDGMDLCPNNDVSGGLLCTDATVYERLRSARQLGNVGTIVGGLGVAAMLAGGYLWYFAPKPYHERPAISIVPEVGPDGGGLTVFGRF